ncbi:hypothetical protein ABBQ32_004751 [Trebouxia sp. C0010 RCD-2024]
MVQVLRGNYTRKTVKFAQIETMTVMMGYRSWGKMTEALLKDQPSQSKRESGSSRHHPRRSHRLPISVRDWWPKQATGAALFASNGAMPVWHADRSEQKSGVVAVQKAFC